MSVATHLARHNSPRLIRDTARHPFRVKLESVRRHPFTLDELLQIALAR